MEIQSEKSTTERMTLLNQITNRSFIDFMKIRKGDKICEFGCGPGFLINDIDHCCDVPEIAGVEQDGGLYQKAVENNLQNKNVRLVPADLPATGLADNEYDIVFCRSFLERVEEPLGAVSEMLRVASPGGKIFAQEGDIANLQLEPEVVGLDALKAAYVSELAAQKRDAGIGRRLHALFEKAGCLHLQISYAPEAHIADHPAGYRLVLQYFRELLCSNLERILKDSSKEITGAFKEIDRRIKEPEGALYFHWNRIEGWKR